MRLILLLIIFLILICLLRKKNIQEDFVDANFKLCEKDDCECLKLQTAPDGTCVKYDVSNTPLVPRYENKKIYQTYVVRNNQYPKKKKSNILIFVGVRMRNRENKYERLPKMIQSFEKKEYGRYSENKECHFFYEVFETANNILEVLDGDKPFLKWLVLDAENTGRDKDIMNSYKLDREKSPAIYMYNETSQEIQTFNMDKDADRCKILQDLIIFIADGDCGLISYLNHLQDPFLGMKFYHDSKNNKWIPDKKKGIQIMENGTDLCKLIDYKDLTPNFKCKN